MKQIIGFIFGMIIGLLGAVFIEKYYEFNKPIVQVVPTRTTEQELDYYRNHLRYFKDDRTKLCYAQPETMYISPSAGFTLVPCTPDVEDLIVGERK